MCARTTSSPLQSREMHSIRAMDGLGRKLSEASRAGVGDLLVVARRGFRIGAVFRVAGVL